MAFEPHKGLVGLVGVFGVAHLLTGLAALLGAVDLLALPPLSPEMLLYTGECTTIPDYDTMLPFDNGFKSGDFAPNVRAWGARQAALSISYFYALKSGEHAAYRITIMLFAGRLAGDIIGNALNHNWMMMGFFIACIPLPCLGAFLMEKKSGNPSQPSEPTQQTPEITSPGSAENFNNSFATTEPKPKIQTYKTRN